MASRLALEGRARTAVLARACHRFRPKSDCSETDSISGHVAVRSGVGGDGGVGNGGFPTSLAVAMKSWPRGEFAESSARW